MAHRLLSEALKKAEYWQNHHQQELQSATGDWLSWSKEVERLRTFEKLKPNDYIETVLHGKATVLAVFMKGKHLSAKVFTGSGESARVLDIQHWGFKGLAKAGE